MLFQAFIIPLKHIAQETAMVLTVWLCICRRPSEHNRGQANEEIL